MKNFKNSTKKSIASVFVLIAGLSLNSCVDKNADLDKVDSDVYLEGTYAFPIVHADSITVSDLLREYGNNSDDEIVLDSILDASSNAYLLALYYHSTFEYGLSDADDNINGSFRELKSELEDVELNLIPSGSGLIYGAKIDLDSISDKHGFKENETPGPGNQYRIHHIDFFNTAVTLSLTPFVAGARIDSAYIGEYGFSVVNNRISGVNFTMYRSDTITVKFSLDSPPPSPVDMKVSLQAEDWTVYGWFDYAFEQDKEEEIEADIKTYIGNSRFQFVDPRITFEANNYNLNVPLRLRVDTVATNLETVDFNSGFGHIFEMTPSTVVDWTYSHPAYDYISISGKDSADYGFSGAKYSRLLDSQLEKAGINMAIYTDAAIFASDTTNDPAVDPDRLQFISSRAKIDIDARAVLPFWIRKGYIEYKDTIPDIDLGQSDSDEDDLNLSNNTEVLIRFTYINGLPIALNAELTFCDDNYLPVKPDGNEWKETIDIPRGRLGADGFVTAPTDGSFDIKLTKAQFDNRRDVSNIIVRYWSPENDGADASYDTGGAGQEVKVRTTDHLTLKAGVKIKGGITVSDK